MFDIIRLVLPYLLASFFLIKGIKKPFYWLGIPFLMFMSESIFIDGAKLFNIPGRFKYALIFFWLVILWLISEILRTKEQNKIKSSNSLLFMDFIIIGLLILSFSGLIFVIMRYPNLTDVFKEFLVIFSIFATYFIIKIWCSENEPELWEKFLFSIVVVNSIAAIFYIIHQGLHIKVYLHAEYLQQIYNGQELTRSSWFMPQFLFFSISYCLVYWKRNPFLMAPLLVINLIATFITYFRSFSIISLAIFLLYFLLTGFKQGRLGYVIRNILILSVLGILFFIFLLKAFPTSTQYYLDRFNELTNPRLSSAPNNLEVRFNNTKFIVSSIEDKMKIAGMGPVTQSQITWVPYMRLITSDMVWTEVIFRWGYIGLVLFIILYVISVLKTLNIFLYSDKRFSNLGLLLLLYIISQIMQSFIDWTFLSGHGYTIGLWYFAFLSALIGFVAKEGSVEEKVVSHE